MSKLTPLSKLRSEETLKDRRGECRLCSKQFNNFDLFLQHKCRDYVTSVMKEAFAPIIDDLNPKTKDAKIVEGFQFESNIKNEWLKTSDRGRVTMMPLDFYDEADTIPQGALFSEFEKYKPAMNLRNWTGNVSTFTDITKNDSYNS